MTFRLENLEEQFLYTPYYGSDEREGWIVNYTLELEESTAAHVKVYFVDKENKNFMVRIPYFFSLLIEGDSLSDIEEYIKRMYQSGFHSSKVIRKHDTKEFNHLSGNGKEFLYIEIKYRSVFNIIVRDLKKIVRLNRSKMSSDIVYNDLLDNKEVIDIKERIIQIHEYDIMNEVDAATKLGIRCGKWYGVSYNGEDYIFKKSSNISIPDLRIFAYDIETMKDPLLFPDAEKDPIMMISIKTESVNELIINRETVSKDISNFTYSPKPEYESYFTINNEQNEKSLIVRFIELIQRHKPHIITTYNGTSFDFPYLERRALFYGLSFNELFGFRQLENSYHCNLMLHLDCYYWVKRDSYLPKGNQGLKAVTKLKLGYFPEEVDPEEMCSMAQRDPETMALYSVSDAVATYFIFTKFVLPHIFSLSSLLPYPPHEVMYLGTGTLCEALLITEAARSNLLIPKREKSNCLKFEDGYAIESISYVGGFVESLRSGVFRSDFTHKFNINELYIKNVVDELDEILINYKNEENYSEIKEKIKDDIQKHVGVCHCNGKIWHLDVGAMYPNIILTNRLQPTAIVNNDYCVRCEYSDESNKCRRPLEWNAKIEFYPPTPQELEDIKEQLIVEYNSKGTDYPKKLKPNEEFKRFEELTIAEQTKIFKSKIQNYSKRVYNVNRSRRTEMRTDIVCQREISFYYDSVKKFRDQRDYYKKLLNEAKKELESSSEESKVEIEKKILIFSSLQIAHKCILNSFYGYVMKNDSRWHSTEMAAIVCNIGSKIIKYAKSYIERIGIPLELDTDGIWALIPEHFPEVYEMSSGRKCSFLSVLLNYHIANKFTNHQFQEKVNGEYVIKSENTISFEIDGPYKAMVIPAALEEDKQLKKRYIILNDDNTFAEIKGFEIVRHGELPIIKRLQEELIQNYGFGKTLDECYKNLAKVASKWLDIIYTKGRDCDDEYILELLTESKTLSKDITAYEGKPTAIVMAARRMSEILGNDILIAKLRVDYIVSRFPDTELVSDRVIPTIVFKSSRREELLKKWCKIDCSLKDLVDWKYYKDRVENNMKRLIAIPAVQQGVENPLKDVVIPSWCIRKDIEYKTLDYGLKASNIILNEEVDNCNNLIKNINFENWKNYYLLLKHKKGIIEVVRDASSGELVSRTLRKEICHKEEYKKVYFDVPKEYCLKHNIKLQKGVFPWSSQEENIPYMEIKYSEFRNRKQDFDRLIQHLAIKKAYELNIDPLQVELCDVGEVGKDLSYLILTSFNYNKEIIYLFSRNNNFKIISKFKHELCEDQDVMKYFIRNKKDILVMNSKDLNIEKMKGMFKEYRTILLESSVVKRLGTFRELIEIQKELHSTLVGKVRQFFDLSFYSKIPLLNLNSHFLDLMFLRALKREKSFCDSHGELSLTTFRTEICNSGYTKRYSIMFECVGSLILSIVQYKKLISQANLYSGIKRKDFEVLHTLVKQILLDYANNKRGAEDVLNKLSSWIMKDSKLLSTELRDVVSLIHQRFVFNIVGNLKKLGIKIIFVSRNIFCIETDKDTAEGCEMFFEYLQEKIASHEGYEFLCLRKLRVFEKLLLFDPSNYFYLKNEEVFSFSSVKFPSCYLKRYFSDDLKDSHFIYDLVSHCEDSVFTVVVGSLRFLKGTEDIVSNCYKLFKKNEFSQTQEMFIEMLIVCKECDNENVLRDRCIKCGVYYTREEKNDIHINYFTYYLALELSNDSFCDKCNRINERVLYDVCRCGGNFKRVSYRETLNHLISQLTNEEKKEEAERALKFYGINQ